MYEVFVNYFDWYVGIAIIFTLSLWIEFFQRDKWVGLFELGGSLLLNALLGFLWLPYLVLLSVKKVLK